MPLPTLEQQPLHEFTEKAYLDYSMYVILDRALPHIGDGLKPVQRRIVYAMSELGLKATAKYKKSARTVGDVLGKFHPHGDSACYEAMVLMTQAFSYRYPLIDGQGNWGSPDDPKSFAAMRYTESRLSPYADTLLAELGAGTVDWVANFDGTLQEPALLPARLPNVLLNGSSGIAVGMATDILPHNCQEVANACIHLLEHPKASLANIMQHIPGPDFPTHAEIISRHQEIYDCYETGQGSIKMRATYKIEKNAIIIDALPYQVSGAKILEQIAQQMQAKKLPMVSDLRDESDHEHPTRLVIIPRSSRIDSESLMSHLFATTDLERSYRANFNMIGIDGRPQVKNLLTILTEWLSYRTETVRRRLQHRLDKIVERLHILAGLLIAFLNIDEVIAIIRYEDEPKQQLMQRFALSDRQADAILDMKLRHLAKLEEIKIKAEQEALSKERDLLERTLQSPQRMKTLLRKEILADAKQYGDRRQSPIVARESAQTMKQEAVLSNEPVTVILSVKGWIRAAKGHGIDLSTLNYKSGDAFFTALESRSHQLLYLLDDTGRCYNLPIHSLPSARGQGDPLTGRLSPPSGAQFIDIFTGEAEQPRVFASDAGYGFIAKLADLQVKNRAGKALVKCPEHSQALPSRSIRSIDNEYVAIITIQGRLLLFPVAELPLLGRGKGNKMIAISSSSLEKREDYLVDFAILGEKDALVIFSGKRQLTLKPTELVHYHGDRGRRGNKLPRGFQRVDYCQRGGD